MEGIRHATNKANKKIMMREVEKGPHTQVMLRGSGGEGEEDMQGNIDRERLSKGQEIWSSEKGIKQREV